VRFFLAAAVDLGFEVAVGGCVSSSPGSFSTVGAGVDVLEGAECDGEGIFVSVEVRRVSAFADCVEKFNWPC
jgi:hypothetical protein